MNTRNVLLGALVIGVLVPTLAFAAGEGGGGGGGAGSSSGGGAAAVTGQGIQQQDQTRDRVQDPTTHTGDEPLQTRDQDRTQLYQTTTTVPTGTGQQAQVQGQAGAGAGPSGQAAQYQYRLQIDPEHLQIRAGNATQLQQMVQTREQELADQASTTPAPDRAALQNANRVRLAVYSMLAAQDLLPGTIGQQVSQLASQVDTSLQASANLEAQVQSRGFFSRLLFGGDSQSGQALAQLASDNQARIQLMTQLLAQATSTPAVQTQLQTQLQTMLQEQDRLMQLGDQEQHQWGIFSWRF